MQTKCRIICQNHYSKKKKNSDKMTSIQSIYNLHVIQPWHLNWKSVFVHLGESSGFDRDESSWPCSVHSGLPPSLLFGRFTCRTRLVIAWVLAYILFCFFRLEVMRTMPVNLTCGLNPRLCSGCPTQCIQHCHIGHIRPEPLCALLLSDGMRKSTMPVCVCAYLSMFVSCFGLCRAGMRILL